MLVKGILGTMVAAAILIAVFDLRVAFVVVIAIVVDRRQVSVGRRA